MSFKRSKLYLNVFWQWLLTPAQPWQAEPPARGIVIIPAPAVIGVVPTEQANAAAWRAGHIADTLEQWKERKGIEHPNRFALVNEALALAHTAVHAGNWSVEQVEALKTRLSS